MSDLAPVYTDGINLPRVAPVASGVFINCEKDSCSCFATCSDLLFLPEIENRTQGRMQDFGQRGQWSFDPRGWALTQNLLKIGVFL